MEGPRERKDRRRVDQEEGRPAEPEGIPRDDAPADELVDRPAGRQREPKVKVTFSLPVSLARLVEVVSAELGVNPCDLVAELLRPGLRGCRKPTIPNELRSLFPPKRGSAA